MSDEISSWTIHTQVGCFRKKERFWHLHSGVVESHSGMHAYTREGTQREMWVDGRKRVVEKGEKYKKNSVITPLTSSYWVQMRHHASLDPPRVHPPCRCCHLATLFSHSSCAPLASPSALNPYYEHQQATSSPWFWMIQARDNRAVLSWWAHYRCQLPSWCHSDDAPWSRDLSTLAISSYAQLCRLCDRRWSLSDRTLNAF